MRTIISKIRSTKWAHRDVKVDLVGTLGGISSLGGFAVALVALAQDRSVPIWALIMIVLGVAAFVWSAGQSLRAFMRVLAYQKRRDVISQTIREEVLRGNDPLPLYFVYLRPFSIDGAYISACPKEADRAYVEKYGWPDDSNSLENTVALLVHPFGELVALSGESSGVGPGYVKSTNLSFKEEVRALCTHAEGIFVVPFVPEGRKGEAKEPGIVQEVEMLIEYRWLHKTFFIMPAMPFLSSWLGKTQDSSRNYRDRWESGRARFPELDLPEYDPGGCVVQVPDGGYVFKVFGYGRYRWNWRDRTRAEGGLTALLSHLDDLTTGNPPR